MLLVRQFARSYLKTKKDNDNDKDKDYTVSYECSHAVGKSICQILSKEKEKTKTKSSTLSCECSHAIGKAICQILSAATFPYILCYHPIALPYLISLYLFPYFLDVSIYIVLSSYCVATSYISLFFSILFRRFHKYCVIILLRCNILYIFIFFHTF